MNNPVLWLYLLLAGFADSPCDLVSCIDADDYFHARDVVVTAEKMEALAAKEPTDNAGQLVRLLAIRWLGDHRVEAARGTLQRLARGRAARDRLGFAQDYAREALARLDGRQTRRGPTRANWLREGLSWFPEDVSCVAALDLSISWAGKPFVLEGFGALAPGRQTDPNFVLRPPILAGNNRDDLYRWAERFGNIRLERLALAHRPSRQPGGKGCMLARLTGRGDHRALLEYFRQATPPSLIAWDLRPGSEPVTLLRDERGGSAVAVVGDTDLLFAVAEDGPGAGFAAAEELLEVRAGRTGSVLRGRLAVDLREVPGHASGLVVGEVPEELPQGTARECGVPAVPHRLVLHLTVDETASIDLRFRGFLGTPEEARTFAESVRQQRDCQAASLAELGPAKPTEVVIAALKSIQVEADGSAVSGSGHISGDVPAALGELLPLAIGQALGKLVEYEMSRTLMVVAYAVLGGLAIVFAIVAVVLLAGLTAWTRRRG
jgi:hypothetical protein